jgi:hypothetical protein
LADTLCDCVKIKTEPVLGNLFEASKIGINTTARVTLKTGDHITLREWAVGGTFKYNVDTKAVALECLAAVSEPIKNEYYQQVSLKAITPNCRWSYKLDHSDGVSHIAFNFIVWPEKEAPVNGTLVALDTLDFSKLQVVNLKANAYLTVRLVETVTSDFAWLKPTHDWKCVELVNENYGAFNTGVTQWLFKAKNSDKDCVDDATLTRAADNSTVVISVHVKRGFCPIVECAEGTI